MNQLLISFCKPVLLVLMVVSFTSCNVSRKVEKRGGYLLNRNIVKTDRPGISQSDLLNFAQPKPNRRFLGLIKSRVWIWDAFNKRTDKGFNRWMIRNFGEPPVLLDTILVHNSLIPMKQHLINKGYFISDVTSSVEIKKSRANVIFSTHTSEPFHFGDITWDISDDTLSNVVTATKSESLLKTGNQYDAYLISQERDRITQLLKNSGYYTFSSNFIFFEIDTLSVNNKAQIKIVITNPADSNDPFHKRYIFNQILINTDYPGIIDQLSNFDTIPYYGSDKSEVPEFYEIYRFQRKLRPEALARAIFVKPGEYYSQKNVNLTYNRLQNLGVSRYVSVNIAAANDTLVDIAEYEELLDCDIRMVRSPVSVFTIEAEGTNAGGLMGLGSSVNYSNRNIFRGAETLRIKTFGAFEIKPQLGVEEDKLLEVFNSLEAGFETGIDFPTLLSPFQINGLDQNARPRTSLGLGFSYELRSPQYERYLSKLSLSYEWNASATSRHFFSPIELSSISIVRDTNFTAYLMQLADPRFLIQYTNHLILALKYSYVFNNQSLTDRTNFFYFRINLEPAGNFLNLFSNITNAPRDPDGKYTLFNLRYAQYFRTDLDFRYYKPLNINQRLVYRVAFGIGLPYGNSVALPFEKGFFAGGANGMRGWAVRELGPGEYNSSSDRFENVGDLSMEANIEYRFPLYNYLNGALFTDVGNIWLLKENVDFPGGHFTFDRALSSLAWDAGFGLRFDFSIFVFRIDGGLPLYDPGKEPGNRFFRPAAFQLRDITWNFGIGYPF